MAERIIGIDFGTSTSVIRVKRYENGRPIGEALETKEVMFGDTRATVPTLIMKKDDDPSVAYFGYAAQQKKRYFTNFSSFKVNLESTNADKRREAQKLTEDFFSYMGKQYRAQSAEGHLGNTDDKERTIISYPVKWSTETKQFMLEAARKAGFPNVSGMDEAQAAIRAVTVMSTGYLQKNGLLQSGVASNILLIDMGAGTTDLVLCRYTPGAAPKTKILTTWPKSGKILFGGKEIDVLLKSFFWDKFDEADAETVFKRIGTDKFKTWKEVSVSPALWNNDSVSDFEALDSCVEMMEIDMDEYCLNRAALEKCLENYLKQLPILINGCIESAGVRGNHVDLVIVTGGHSQWYFVHEMLSGKMSRFGDVDLPKIKANPARIIPVTRPQETVALGLVYSPMQDTVFTAPSPVMPKPEPPKPVPPKPVPPKPAPPQPAPPMPVLPKPAVSPPVLQKTFSEQTYTPESEFELMSEGENYVIKKYIGKRKIVSIPPVIRGRKVVAIGTKAFFNGHTVIAQYYVETIIIPNTVSRIDAQAFYHCRKLQYVVIPDSVRIISDWAFGYCSRLEKVQAHDKVEIIGTGAFYSCKSLISIDFGEGFCGNKIVRFPKGLKQIGGSAFTEDSTGLSRCIFREVILSRSTKVKNRIGEKTFHPKHCAVFYYN